ncbi:hypothetical protein ACWF9G_26450 [Nocardia sp. NPDC055029]|uniref:hypothetical protein n=1 Tax=Nocardia sp. NPDC060259 TaxID=3347088 RepID=UPI003648FEA5
MTVITQRRRARAVALVGGFALLTGTIAGVAGAATADPAVTREIGPERTLIICSAPGAPGVPALPLLPNGVAPGPRIHLEHFEGEPATPLPALPARPGEPSVELPGDCERAEHGDAPGGVVVIRPPHVR